ncbi:MAG TPA: IS1595 family transposase [Gaiellaceae bacterium]|nr:IS1595 family transposase [Gaiellaceae bacterium]
MSQSSVIVAPARSPLEDDSWLTNLERTEERCRRYLEDLRWPEGVACPRCGSHSIGEIPARRRYYCRGCRYHFSVTSGTVFHNSHLPIWKWFLAIELMLDAESGMPANQLVRLLGGSYKTAWFVEHRIRAAIVQAGERPHESEAVRPTAYHRPGEKYLLAYLAETSWCARHRGNPRGFGATVLALLDAEPVPYGELIARESRPHSARSRG